jgi:hypothetical protein
MAARRARDIAQDFRIAQREIERQQRRLHHQADGERDGRRQHEVRMIERQDRAAIADRRQREHGAGENADRGRAQRAGMGGARLERNDYDASGGDEDRRGR